MVACCYAALLQLPAAHLLLPAAMLLCYCCLQLSCCDTLYFVAGQLRLQGESVYNLKSVCKHVCPILHSPASW